MEFTQFAIYHKGKPIDLSRRPWLPDVYNFTVSHQADESRRKLLLVTGRQSEKCCVSTTRVLKSDNIEIMIKDVQVGDEIVTLLHDGAHLGSRRVTWKSAPLKKNCVRLTTRLGHVLDVARTHPIRRWGCWTPAGDLHVGDRVASVRRLPPGAGIGAEEDHVILLAYMVADGCVLPGSFGFTQVEGPVSDEMVNLCYRNGWTVVPYGKAGTQAIDFRFRRGPGTPFDLIRSWGLLGKRSDTKYLPDWSMRLPDAQTALLLNRLWACDGHVSRRTPSRYEIVYSTISQQLARQMQALLWRFGIPTRIRIGIPAAYKENGKRHYMLTVQTQDGVRTFLSRIGALGKSEGVPLPESEENNNRDTFPIEVAADLRAIAESTGLSQKARGSLFSGGLRLSPKYPLSHRKLREYIKFFREKIEEGLPYDSRLVDALDAHVSTDLIWDEIVSIEDLGEQECFDIEVEDTHNFVADGVVTHNSTTIGNICISLANLIQYLRLLYVTASHAQMREFSDERLRAVIADSPILQAMTGVGLGTGMRETQNVLTKRWISRAKLTLRSVYKNADRVRGIPTDVLAVDELQDILVDNLPVIEETLFASSLDEGPISIYAGTPKSFDNAIEFYWSRYSTQNEWMTRCSSCGRWNCIDEKHLRPFGLGCEKCGKELNPVDGEARWVCFGNQEREWEGFHLCQPIVLYAYRHQPEVFERKWRGLMAKRKRYTRQRFMNEVMGRSYDAGTKPVTLEEVRRCCIPQYTLTDRPTKHVANGLTWAGIDWGSGEISYSILSIWRYDSGGRFTLCHAKRYEGVESDSDFVIADMIRTCARYKVARIGADWGFGFHANPQLRKAFGAARVIFYAHTGNQKEKIHWDKAGGKFTTHRTRVLQDVFTLIKSGPVGGGIAFPNWEDFETYANDILAVYQEFDERAKQLVFDHPKGVPDDFLHTAVYALLASQFDHPRPDLHAPSPTKKSR